MAAFSFALRKAGTRTSLWATSQLPVKVANTNGLAWALVSPGNNCIAPKVRAVPISERRENGRLVMMFPLL